MSDLPFKNVCHNCGQQDSSVRHRSFRGKNYMGPCGDSFCYHSCDMSSCKGIEGNICDKCEKKLKGKEDK